MAETPDRVVVTAHELTRLCDRRLVGLASDDDLHSWARDMTAAVAAGRAELDPAQALVLRPALTEIGACASGDLDEVVRTWMATLYPPRCGS